MTGEQTMFESLAELIGKEEALILCEMIGGQTLYIPKNIGLDDGIRKLWVEHFGEEAFDRICDRFGGQRIYIPAAPPELIELRNATIVGRVRSGDPINDIARDFKVTPRCIRNIFNRVVNGGVIEDAKGEGENHAD